MPKNTPDTIAALGLSSEMLALDSQEALSGLIDSLLVEQAGLLSARIGATAYSTATEPLATYVTRAEKCLVAAELMRLRILAAMGNAIPNGDEPNTASLERYQKKYEDEATALIDKIVSGQSLESSGFSTGVTVSEPMAKVGHAGYPG